MPRGVPDLAVNGSRRSLSVRPRCDVRTSEGTGANRLRSLRLTGAACPNRTDDLSNGRLRIRDLVRPASFASCWLVSRRSRWRHPCCYRGVAQETETVEDYQDGNNYDACDESYPRSLGHGVSVEVLHVSKIAVPENPRIAFVLLRTRPKPNRCPPSYADFFVVLYP